MAEEDPDQESTANSTLSRMLAGNRRFAEGHSEHPWQDMQTRESLIDRQNPDAAVLSCSDSRVPPEIIFDAGLGDLFTIRTAGQIIDDAVLASLEYAVDHLHVSLLMVMGHEGCGAVALGAEQLDALIADSTSDPESSLESADAMAELDERIASSDSIVLSACRYGRRGRPSWIRARTSNAYMWRVPSKSWSRAAKSFRPRWRMID